MTASGPPMTREVLVTSQAESGLDALDNAERRAVLGELVALARGIAQPTGTVALGGHEYSFLDLDNGSRILFRVRGPEEEEQPGAILIVAVLRQDPGRETVRHVLPSTTTAAEEVEKQLDPTNSTTAAPRFSDAPQAPLREQVARALVQKGIALDQLGRGEEAVAVYDEVVRRFGDASEAARPRLDKAANDVAPAPMPAGLRARIGRGAMKQHETDHLVSHRLVATRLLLTILALVLLLAGVAGVLFVAHALSPPTPRSGALQQSFLDAAWRPWVVAGEMVALISLYLAVPTALLVGAALVVQEYRAAAVQSTQVNKEADEAGFARPGTGANPSTPGT
jgi:hypothetical protein